jgi:Flp pilus assembly protein TadB
MAQTKRKRQTKHRGNQAGQIESKGRTSRPRTRAEARSQAMNRKSKTKVERANRPPSWRNAAIRAGVAALVFMALLIVMRQPIASALAVGVLMFGLYIPMGYYTDVFLYNRRVRKDQEEFEKFVAEKEANKNK